MNTSSQRQKHTEAYSVARILMSTTGSTLQNAGLVAVSTSILYMTYYLSKGMIKVIESIPVLTSENFRQFGSISTNAADLSVNTVNVDPSKRFAFGKIFMSPAYYSFMRGSTVICGLMIGGLALRTTGTFISSEKTINKIEDLFYGRNESTNEIIE